MSEEITKEEFEALKEQLKATNEKLETQTADYEKLQKIFNERQTKTLDKEGILKILGAEKVEKPITEILSEKLGSMETEITKLNAELTKRDEALALNAKKAKVAELAKKANFIDVSDVEAAIDFSKDNFEEQIKAIAELKPHWVQKVDTGSSFAGVQGRAGTSIDEQITEAYKNNDIQLAMALKRQKVIS